MHFSRNLICSGLTLLLYACAGDQKDNPSREREYTAIVDQASVKIDAGNPEAAFRYIDSSSAARKPLTVLEQYWYHRFYCNYYLHYAHDYKKSFSYADSMLRLIEKQHNKKHYLLQLSETNYSIGDILFAQNKYNEAYKYFYIAKRIAKSNFNPCVLSDYSYRMGMILYKQMRYAPAATYFKQSYSESFSCKDDFSSFYRKQELLNNTALSYMKYGQADSALQYYRKSLSLIDKNQGRYPDKSLFYEIARAVIYGNEAQAYQLKGDNLLAEELYRKSIDVNSRPNHDNSDALYNRIHLAGLLFQQNRLTDLDNELSKVKRSLDKKPDASAELNYRDLLWKYYRQTGDNKSSLANLLMCNALKDSISRSSRDLTTANASEQLDILEKQYEISFLKKNKEIDDLYFRILIVVAVLSAAVILLIYQNWKRSKTNLAGLRDLNQKVMEQKIRLEQTLDELEHQSREKDRILRAVAHDLRNPIGGVESVSAILLDEDLLDEHKEMLSLIQATCKDSLLLINEILEISNINNTVNLQKDSLDVNNLLFNTIELLRFKATEKQQQIAFQGVPHTGMVSANREKLIRVISNLISNAIKFSASGKTVQVRAVKTGEKIRISVEDNGIGIPDSIKLKVFDTFTEAKRTGTSGEKPFGLGLSISKQIVEALNGRIWFEPNPAGGSIFHVELDAPAVSEGDNSNRHLSTLLN